MPWWRRVGRNVSIVLSFPPPVPVLVKHLQGVVGVRVSHLPSRELPVADGHDGMPHVAEIVEAGQRENRQQHPAQDKFHGG